MYSNGLINALIVRFGGEAVNWMGSSCSFMVLVISYIWKNLGYDMILWLAGLAGISPEIYEAARVDGAGEWNCFTQITLPNLRPSLYTITVLSFLNSFKVFREAWLVAGDYPNQSMYLLQHLYNNWFRELLFDKISASAVVTAAVVLVLILLLQKAWGTEV
ncbi:MAG: sugar ABC transporter permease [Lachnospiraceae bacterium]|nr:sugar ABC transporter permease [Lachnospiraceae bacterium]